MRAAVFYGKGSMCVEERELRDVQDNELLIRVRACGVCGTDIHIYHGSPGSATATPPVVLGHEYAGEVIKVGEKVKEFSIGDRVAIDPNIYCHECWFCRNGQKHLCKNLTALGVNVDGGFAEYCIIPAAQAYAFPDGISFEEAAMVEPLACCLHGIDRAGILAGQKVAIMGGGAIGLIMLQLARLQGASCVVVSEPIAGRGQLAVELGADTVINPLEQGSEQLFQQVCPEGFDVAIECVGKETAITQAVHVTRRGGTILIFGVSAVDTTVSISPFEIFKKELTIKGSFINPDTHGRAMALISSGRINVKPLITHRFDLEKVEEAFRIHSDPQTVKIIVQP